MTDSVKLLVLGSNCLSSFDSGESISAVSVGLSRDRVSFWDGIMGSDPLELSLLGSKAMKLLYEWSAYQIRWESYRLPWTVVAAA